ncbi:hypothetical protein A3K55_02540 [Candidatus Shapirobacteria bacterium RBG_13_44_7]|uniref:L-threonylcarbamoyladenylate synthase n=1 Tax=Candidatus Shapirobacteria bacterium RBG_13_44_7 TaxID=1802149 RepID=A0A1F7SJZ9_9BACT|nr:MAG: hypothetical protein A3K55_02540 [Candidatus Shapirobacteria bacterium RBG_13_44_7]
MERELIKKAAKTIKKGGLVVYPSDTVYILAVDPTRQEAVDKLLAFKDRWTGKAISVAVADKKMAKDYVRLSLNAESIYDNLLPGPFTVVSEGKHRVAKGIEAENGTLGIRIPDNKYILGLVKVLGKPITATSANLSGRRPHYSVESLMKTLSDKKRGMIDLVVDVGKLPRNKPSTVIETSEPEIKVLRRGDLITGDSQSLISKSVRETEKIAEFLYKKNGKLVVFGLSGNLGCGKTVFSRGLGKVLGVKEKITSPTFVIFNEYKTRGGKFLHFDLYRITTEQELEEINFLEQFGRKMVACIEWPENMGGKYLDRLKRITKYIPVNFEYVDEKTRKITFGGGVY